MKQLFNKSLVIVAILATMEGYSKELNIPPKEKLGNVTNIKIDNVAEGSLLSIKDSAGLILYTESIEITGIYFKKFDLTNLPDADYYFELDNQEEIKIIPFSVEAKVAEFKNEAEFKIVKPLVTVENDRVYISKLSLDTQLWEIDVYYNEDNDLAYSEKLKNTQNLNRVYDFSSSKKGNYTIVLSSDNRVFTNNITIR